MEDNNTPSNPIGKVITLSGNVSAESSSGSRILKIGSPLYQGDILVTANDGKVEIHFQDNTQLSQGENSRISLDSYIYDADDGNDSGLLLNMVEGTFRCVTGKIVEQRPDNFILKSPLATLGIRGTTTVSEIKGHFEKHGAEDISSGKSMVLQDNMGTTRFITSPQSIVDFSPGKSIGMPRSFTKQEFNHFRTTTPLSIEHHKEQPDRDDTHDEGTEAENYEKDINETTDSAPHEARNDITDMDTPAESSGDTPKPSLSQSVIQNSGNEYSIKPVIDIYSQQKTDTPEKKFTEIQKTGSTVLSKQNKTEENKSDDETNENDEPQTDPVDNESPDDNENDEGGSDNTDETKPDDTSDINDVEDNSGDENNGSPTEDGTSPEETGPPSGSEDTADAPPADETGEDITEDPTDEETPNTPPTAEGSNITTQEETPVSGILSASDADGDPIIFQKVTDPQNGTVSIGDDGSYTYTPNDNFNGTDRFSFLATDDSGVSSGTGTVTITVENVNDAPETTGSTLEINEDASGSGVLTATDSDEDILTFSIATGPAHGSAELNKNGSFTYTPENNYHGPDLFTFEVNDGQGGKTTATVNVTVAPINDAPEADNLAFQTDQNISHNGILTATDIDKDDSLTFSIISSPANGIADISSNGNFTYLPSNNYHGPDNFTFKVDDGNGGISTGSVDITVIQTIVPNSAPTTGNLLINTGEDTSINAAVTATDINNDPLTFSKTSSPGHGTVSFNTDGTFTYTPTDNYWGEDSFNFDVKDNSNETDTGTVYINVGSTTGNDTINGGSTPDTIYGLEGDDLIDAGTGNDFVSGDLGNDHIKILSDMTYEDTVSGGLGTDTLEFTDSTGTNELTNVTGIEEIILSNQATDIVTPDSLIDSGMTLTIDGTALMSGALYWDGSNESDGKFNLTAGDYIDTIKGGAGDDTLIGGHGDDSIEGNGGNDSIDGQDEYNQLFGGAGNDTITAGIHNDTIQGDGGNDSISSGAGNDFLQGGTGTDTITGGAGNDTFSYTESNEFGDLITDFNATLGDEIKINIDAAGLFSEIFYGGNVRLIQSTGNNGFSYPITVSQNAKYLFSAASVAAFSNSIKSVNIGAIKNCLAFGLVGTGPDRKLIAAVGKNTDADTTVESVATYTIATLQNVSSLGPSANQLDIPDILVY